MKRKSIITFLLCLTLSVGLVGCKKESAEDTFSEDMATVEQAINLSGVEAGTLLDNATLVNYANSLTGRSDISSVMCNTETETGLFDVTLVEGIHTLVLQYTTSSGETGEVALVYEAYAAVTEEVVEEVTEEVVEEVVEENIPIEDRIRFELSYGTESFTDEEFKANEELEAGTLVNITDIASTLSMYESTADMGDKQVSNKFSRFDGELQPDYDNDNYLVTLKNNLFVMEEYAYFAVESESALEGIYFGFKLTEEALADPEVMNDLCNEIFSRIEDYYTVLWNYEALIVEEATEETAEETTTVTVNKEDKLTAVIEDSYQSRHPELYIWPEPEFRIDRWDYRYTNSTSFKGIITLGDGTVIPEEQQNQDGYSYDLSPDGSGATGNRNNTATSNLVASTEVTIKSGSKAFRVNDYNVENIKVNKEESSSNRVVLEQNGDKYYVTTILSSEWLKYANTDYYVGNLSEFEVKPIESLEIGAGPLKTTIIGRDASFLDSTGTEVTRQYMYGIDCGTDFIIIVGDDLPSRGNTTLYNIAKWCLEPIEAE